MESETIALGVMWYVVFLFSTTCHEAGHAWAAKLGGDLTAFYGGQVSLSPLPHIKREPFGMVLMPLLTFFANGWMMGWASAPYDPYWSRRHPKRAAWMSLAGPGANFTLVLLAVAAIRIGMLAGIFQTPRGINFTHVVAASPMSGALGEGLATFLSILFSLNLLLGAFNLIPLPPLDGYSVLGIFVPESTAVKLEDFRSTIGPFTIVGLIVAWQVFDKIFGPVYDFGLQLLYLGH
jgi:Zn-dependent protease